VALRAQLKELREPRVRSGLSIVTASSPEHGKQSDDHMVGSIQVVHARFSYTQSTSIVKHPSY